LEEPAVFCFSTQEKLWNFSFVIYLNWYRLVYGLAHSASMANPDCAQRVSLITHQMAPVAAVLLSPCDSATHI
jgi:hypothetical protein